MRLNKVRVITYILGLLILSFGVALTIQSRFGTGAWDALNVGLSKIAFTVGTWVVIVGIILIIINALLLKSRPDFYALITIFITGFGIDFWLLVLKPLDPSTWIVKLIIFLAGLVFLSLGIAIYLQAKFAPVPIDNLMLTIHKRFGVSIGVAKTIGECIALVLAFIFKGPIGIGTIIVTLFIGPIIHFFFVRIEKIVARYQ